MGTAALSACSTEAPTEGRDLGLTVPDAPLPAGYALLGEYVGAIGPTGLLEFTPAERDGAGRVHAAASTGSVSSKSTEAAYVLPKTILLANNDATACGVAGVTCAVTQLENHYGTLAIGNAHAEIITLTPAGNEFDPAITATSRSFLAGMRNDLGLADYGTLMPAGTTGGADIAKRFWRFKTTLPAGFRLYARVVGIPFDVSNARAIWRADTCATACCQESGCPTTGLGVGVGDAQADTIVSSAYSQLTDQTGAGRHLTQGTATARPARIANAVGGYKPTARFDGTDDTLANTSTGIGSLADATVVLVASPRVGSGSSRRFFSASTGASADTTAGLAIHSGATTSSAFDALFAQGAKGSPGNLKLASDTLSSPHVLTIAYANGTSNVALWVDGVAAGTATGSSTNAAFDVLRLASASPVAVGQYLNVDISEAMVFGALLGSTQRGDIETYLKEKYQILPGQSEGTDAGNTCATAAAFTVPGRTSATINPAGDVDVFSITTTTVTDMRIDTFDASGPSSCVGIDTEIQVFNSSCTAITAVADDNGTALCASFDSGYEGALRAMPAGTYYIRVRRSTGGFAGGSTTFGYTTQVSFNATCGNSIREGSEECDRGAGDATCSATCKVIGPVCGDRVVTSPETCDDGNTTSGDGCTSACALESGYACGTTVGCVPVCGDALQVGAEQCDDGDRAIGGAAGTRCDAACRTESVVAEIEANGTAAQADATGIVLTGASTTLTGAISTAADEDWFKLTLSAQSTVRAETFDTSGSDCSAVATTIELRNSAGNAISLSGSNPTATLSDTTRGIASCSSIAANVAAGTYYVRVRGTGANTPSYRVHVKAQTDNGSEVESNAGVSTATPLVGSDVVVFGDHTSALEDDFYAIYVPAGRGVRAEIIEGDSTRTCARMTNQNAEQDSILTLYNSSGTQLVQDDDGGRAPCSLIDGTGSSGNRKDAAAGNLAAGTYYLRVSAWQPGGQYAARAQFKYRLLVSVR